MVGSGPRPLEAGPFLEVALHEYDALRAEILDARRSASQVTALALGGAGVLVTAIGFSSTRPELALDRGLLLQGAAALLGLLALVYVAQVNHQLDIATYLRLSAILIRRAVGAATDRQASDTMHLMTWEDWIGGLANTRKPRWLAWSFGFHQAAELAAVIALPAVAFVFGWPRDYVVSIQGLIDRPLFAADGAVLTILVLSLAGTLRLQRIRDSHVRSTATSPDPKTVAGGG